MIALEFPIHRRCDAVGLVWTVALRGIHVFMNNLPYELEPLAQDRDRLFAILGLLDESTEDVVRADLAVELIAVGSRYEDIKQRALYPAIASHVADSERLERTKRDQEAVRESLSEIRRRTQHVKPAYVHVDDPEGFEAALAVLVTRIRDHIADEDNELFPALAALDDTERENLRTEVEQAVAHASSSPSPATTALGRFAMAAVEKLDHIVDHDESAPWHPGVDKLEETLDEKTPTA